MTIGDVPPLHIARRPSRPRLRNVIPKIIIDELMREEQFRGVVTRELLCKLAQILVLEEGGTAGDSPPEATPTGTGFLCKHSLLTRDITTAMLSEYQTKLYLINDLKQLSNLTSLVCLRERKRLDLLETLLGILRTQGTTIECIIVTIHGACHRHLTPMPTFYIQFHRSLAPDYRTFITHPMDLSTILHNTKNNHYTTLDHYHKDLRRVWDNALEYNEGDTVYHKAALALKKQTENEMRVVRRVVQRMNIKRR